MAAKDKTFSKAKLRDRLTAEGRWGEFVRLRERLKREGVDPMEAWIRAAEEFPAQEGVEGPTWLMVLANWRSAILGQARRLPAVLFYRVLPVNYTRSKIGSKKICL